MEVQSSSLLEISAWFHGHSVLLNLIHSSIDFNPMICSSTNFSIVRSEKEKHFLYSTVLLSPDMLVFLSTLSNFLDLGGPQLGVLQFNLGLLKWLSGKDSACSGLIGSIPGSGRSPGEGSGHPLQYSCLGNPMDRGAWRASVHGVAKESDTT